MQICYSAALVLFKFSGSFAVPSVGRPARIIKATYYFETYSLMNFYLYSLE